MRKIVLILTVLAAVIVTGCTDAEIASRNLSTSADMFQLDRRIVFYNGITGDYILVIKGRCSITARGKQLAVTCKTGPGVYKKHYLGLSDNVTYFSEQIESAGVDVYHYKVIFKPSVIVPDIRIKH